jgi:hypothetical protein
LHLAPCKAACNNIKEHCLGKLLLHRLHIPLSSNQLLNHGFYRP